MGLDMGLLRKKKRGNSKEVEVAYWRKANQIHAWFVNNLTDSKPDEWSGEVLVPKEKLIELKEVCQEIIDSTKLVKARIQVSTSYKTKKDGSIIEKPIYKWGKTMLFKRKAKKLLPTCEGFFFGSTNYDQYYYEDLKSTVDQIEKVLIETDFDKEKILYYAWW